MTTIATQEFLSAIEEHNRPLDCFSEKYRLPIRRHDGTCSYVTRDGGTALDGSATFTLPQGADPLICWEPAYAPWLPEDAGIITIGHDIEQGPTHPCPHCLRLRGTNGQTVWIWVDGKLMGRSTLSNTAEDE